MKPTLIVANEAVTTLVMAGQNKYFKKTGKYIQTLDSHDSFPGDEIATKPNKSRKPNDQKEYWDDLCILPSFMKTCVAVDVYEGPLGWGYIINYVTEDDSEVWACCVDCGPEGRSRGWYKCETLNHLGV